MSAISSSAASAREHARRTDGRFGEQGQADPGQLGLADRPDPQRERMEAFCAAVTPEEVMEAAGVAPADRRSCQDHFQVATYLHARTTNSHPASAAVASKLETHARMFGPYGEFARYRSEDSWETDRVLDAARRAAKPADLDWDRPLGARIEPSRILSNTGAQLVTDTSDREIGLLAHQTLLGQRAAEPLAPDDRAILEEFALKYGPHGRFRDLAD